MLNSQQYDIVIKNNTVVISLKTAEEVTEETTVVDNSLSLRGGEINKIDNGGKKQANADAKVDSDKKNCKMKQLHFLLIKRQQQSLQLKHMLVAKTL